MTPRQIDFYSSIELSEDEVREAILQAKIAKHFREKHREYWENLEAKKVGETLDSHRENRKL